MDIIVSCKALVKRIRSLFVINLDFYFYNDSVFHLGKNNLLPIFKIMVDEEEQRRSTIKKQGVDIPTGLMKNEVLATIIDELANKLFTVCAIHMEKPYIQY